MKTARMLVVEDESVVAMDIQKGLTSLGYPRPEIAYSGREAVQKATEMQPDLVLMDIRLKGDIDGVEAAQQIRLRLGIPVVYLTAYADDETVERAKRTQPYGYIIKPFREKELYSTIEVALYNHKMESQFKRRVQSRVRRIESEREELARRQRDVENERYQTSEVEHVQGRGDLIRELHRIHPEWPQKRIAIEAGVTRAAIGHALKKEKEDRFPPGEYCGTSEAAHIMKISQKSLVTKVRNGELEADRFGAGGPWMFRRDYLQSILGNDTSTPATFIDATEAAAYLGISRRTLWRWARAEKLRATKIAGSREWRFCLEDIKAIAQGTTSNRRP